MKDITKEMIRMKDIVDYVKKETEAVIVIRQYGSESLVVKYWVRPAIRTMLFAAAGVGYLYGGLLELKDSFRK